MPEAILAVLKLVFLGVLYLFFLRVLRAVWLETRESTRAPAGAATGARSVAAASPATMRIVAPAERKGETFALGEEMTVGRAAGCQVSLADDSTVSQLHARIFQRDGRFFVEDLGSTNGTFVNRKQITGAVPVRRGDRVQIGQTVLELAR